MKGSPKHPAIAAGEPGFIRRLPEGVEYTHIKAIFMNLPSSLTTLLWADKSPGTAHLTAFKGRTVRATDRALRVRKKAFQIANMWPSSATSSSSFAPNYPPEGWRLITQHAVPALYECLRPVLTSTSPSAYGTRGGPRALPR